MQNSSPPIRASRSPARSRLCAARVNSRRHSSPAAWPWLTIDALEADEIDHQQREGLQRAVRARAFLVEPASRLGGGWRPPVRSSTSPDPATSPRSRSMAISRKTEVPHHRQEHQHTTNQALHRVEVGERDHAALFRIAAARAQDIDRQHRDGDAAGEARAGIAGPSWRENKQRQRQQGAAATGRWNRSRAGSRFVVPHDHEPAEPARLKATISACCATDSGRP